MELADVLKVAEHDVLLASQRLRHSLQQDLRDVVVDDVVESTNVVFLGLKQFLHHQRQHSTITSTLLVVDYHKNTR